MLKTDFAATMLTQLAKTWYLLYWSQYSEQSFRFSVLKLRKKNIPDKIGIFPIF